MLLLNRRMLELLLNWRMLLLLLLLMRLMRLMLMLMLLLLDAAGWLCDGHKDVVSQSDGNRTSEHPRARGEIRGTSGMDSRGDSGCRSG